MLSMASCDKQDEHGSSSRCLTSLFAPATCLLASATACLCIVCLVLSG